MLEWIKQHWVIFTALFFVGTAWGQQQVKLTNLEQAVKKQAETNEKLDKIKEDLAKNREKALTEMSEIKQQNARIEERLNILVSMQRSQQRIANGSSQVALPSSRQ